MNKKNAHKFITYFGSFEQNDAKNVNVIMYVTKTNNI